jgi:hypothetical protein
MLECTYIDIRTEKRIDIETLGWGLVWLAVGALLGLAVALPYDRLLGLPGSAGTLLSAAVWIALLGVFHVGRIKGVVEWREDLCDPTGQNHPENYSGTEHARLSAHRA